MNHKDYYIHLLMNTLSPSDFRKECERLKHILGAHPKPQRSTQSQKYVDFIKSNIYKGNTGFDLFCKHFGVKTSNQTIDFWEQKTGLNKDQLQVIVDNTAKQANIIIKNKFKELSSVLESMID
ncbi:hypothetical protein [uncultured Mediterranean phage]|nr:hypothetical protein [uncultured Mediterranean phage]